MATLAIDQYAELVILSGYPPLGVCSLFSSDRRKERKAEGEDGGGGEAVELYWKSFP